MFIFFFYLTFSLLLFLCLFLMLSHFFFSLLSSSVLICDYSCQFWVLNFLCFLFFIKFYLKKMKASFIEFHTQNFNKNITYLLFVLSNKNIIVNLHKLCFLSSHLSSQSTKRVFNPNIFLPPNKHNEEKLKYLRSLYFFILTTKQALTSSYHYRYQEFSTKIPLNISHRCQQFSTKTPLNIKI